MGGTVDDHVFTNDVIIAKDARRLLTTELEVLWQGANDGTLMHLVLLAHSRSAEDADEGEDDTAVAYLYIVFDIDKGEYLTVVADLRLGRYFSFRTYFACHNSYILLLTFLTCHHRRGLCRD